MLTREEGKLSGKQFVQSECKNMYSVVVISLRMWLCEVLTNVKQFLFKRN